MDYISSWLNNFIESLHEELGTYKREFSMLDLR